MSKEDLMKFKQSHYLTVGALKKFIEEHNIPDDALVMSQRVHDLYFEKNGWGVYKKHGLFSQQMMEFNQNLEQGVYDNPEEYPLMTEKHKVPYSQEDIEAAMEQYHPVWSPVKYRDEDDLLFLDLHY